MKNFNYTKPDGTTSLRCLTEMKEVKHSFTALDVSGLGPDEVDVVVAAVNTWKKTVLKEMDAELREVRKKYETLESFVQRVTGMENKAWIKSFSAFGLAEVAE